MVDYGEDCTSRAISGEPLADGSNILLTATEHKIMMHFFGASAMLETWQKK